MATARVIKELVRKLLDRIFQQRCDRYMRPAQAIEVQEHALRILKLRTAIPLCVDEILNPERCVHLRRLRVWLAASALQEGYVRSSSSGGWWDQVSRRNGQLG